MRREELLPNDERASISSIRAYQRKIGSILYAAVITRPDVAFAAARLARFNANPGPEHHLAADQVLLYLRRTKTLALQFGGSDVFTVASDASFADNTTDRKSSQAYVMQLFGGTIGWRSNKQSTVTTSTTEAELLALAQAAKESMFVSRLITELGVQLDEQRIQIFCDNQQTIKLVNKDINKLQTKLRHVDIHNHWLRQEAQRNKIMVEYKPTADMVADGLTKAIGGPGFQRFVQQIGLTDISEQLSQRRLHEIGEEGLWEGLAKLELDDRAVSAGSASTGGLC
ncbi:polyprotein [Purpureocillium lilacinum]|uniref:Polyprotein n=1 Tax=Purpureocillium lilacinum TaxID=33203 RepID=A0A179EWZ2_PURLI|nr:polyprotein [Purpureocillium lilacinum]